MDKKDNEVKKIIEDAIIPTLQSEYIKGVKTGWVSALLSFKSKTKDLHNADKIKKELNIMIEEAKNRNKSEPTP